MPRDGDLRKAAVLVVLATVHYHGELAVALGDNGRGGCVVRQQIGQSRVRRKEGVALLLLG